MLQKFDPTRFALRADQPNGTQAVAHQEPVVALSRVASLFAADPIARERALQALAEVPQPPENGDGTPANNDLTEPRP